MKPPRRVVVHLARPWPGQSFDNTLAALARMGAQIRAENAGQKRRRRKD